MSIKLSKHDWKWVFYKQIYDSFLCYLLLPLIFMQDVFIQDTSDYCFSSKSFVEEWKKKKKKKKWSKQVFIFFKKNGGTYVL